MIRATLLCLSLTGCMSTTDLIDALAKDENAVCVRITTLYGSAEYSRNGGCVLQAITVPTKAP